MNISESYGIIFAVQVRTGNSLVNYCRRHGTSRFQRLVDEISISRFAERVSGKEKQHGELEKDINEHNDVVGYDYLLNGERHAFVMKGASVGVPGEAILGVIGIGMVGASTRKRRLTHQTPQ